METIDIKTKIDNKVEEIATEVTSDGYAKVSTCDHYNWDRTLHHYFPQIAAKLRERGFNVTSSVNWGVTDWTITLNI